MGRLQDQMRMDMELKNLIPRIRSCYLTWMKSFALHFHRAPDELGEQEIQDYLHYLNWEPVRLGLGRRD
jgi:hypothetical protein